MHTVAPDAQDIVIGLAFFAIGGITVYRALRFYRAHRDVAAPPLKRLAVFIAVGEIMLFSIVGGVVRFFGPAAPLRFVDVVLIAGLGALVGLALFSWSREHGE